MVSMTTLTDIYEIRSGDRIAQLVPTPVLTGSVTESTELTSGARGSRASAVLGVDDAVRVAVSLTGKERARTLLSQIGESL